MSPQTLFFVFLGVICYVIASLVLGSWVGGLLRRRAAELDRGEE